LFDAVDYFIIHLFYVGVAKIDIFFKLKAIFEKRSERLAKDKPHPFSP
jgi:hypothetical protein